MAITNAHYFALQYFVGAASNCRCNSAVLESKVLAKYLWKSGVRSWSNSKEISLGERSMATAVNCVDWPSLFLALMGVLLSWHFQQHLSTTNEKIQTQKLAYCTATSNGPGN